MPFEHACFISYCHNEGKLMTGFMKQLVEALNSTIEIYLKNKKVYIDEELVPGADYQKDLARAICKSICMVVVYTPAYNQSDFCLKEFTAMEVIEKKRKLQMQLLGKRIENSLIIPIVLRGGNMLPPKIKDIEFIDFSKLSLADLVKNIFENEKIIDKIETVAKTIQEHDENFREIADVCGDCDSFTLPTEGEITSWFKASPFPKM